MLWFSRRYLGWMLTAAVLTGILFLRREGETDRMLSYMEEKYGEDFADGEAWAGQTGKAYTMRKVHRVGRPGDSILVRAMEREELVFQDNYLAYLLRDEIEERMRLPAREAFGECKVYYRIPELVFPAEFPADMEVDAFLRHPLSMVRIYIYVKNSPSDRQAQIDAFLAALFREHYIIGGVVSYPAGEEMYERITAENFTGDIYQGYERLAEAVFAMNKEGELSYLKWLSGKEEKEDR